MQTLTNSIRARSPGSDEDFELDSGGLAYVINDDFYNAYQRRT